MIIGTDLADISPDDFRPVHPHERLFLDTGVTP